MTKVKMAAMPAISANDSMHRKCGGRPDGAGTGNGTTDNVDNQKSEMTKQPLCQRRDDLNSKEEEPEVQDLYKLQRR